MASSSAGPVRALYIHVPFCARKCHYCAFYSETLRDGLTDRYTAALIGELRMVADDLAPKTIFFGGGTPSILSIAQWEKIFAALEVLELPQVVEWTVECNPATVSADKARLFKEHGVTRISLGVQSFEPDLLERLGRIHTRDQVFRSLDIFRQADFRNINVDLMFALPGQSMAQWRRTLDEALALGTEHLACYEVIYEEDTPLYEQWRSGAFQTDDDLAGQMYEALLERSAGAGLAQYEIANFARGPVAPDSLTPEHACRHNLGYWNGSSFYGLGPAASEFVGGVRRSHAPDTVAYCSALEMGRRPPQTIDVLPPLARAGEIAAFGLRRTAGWDRGEFVAATGFDLFEGWQDQIDRTVREELGEIQGGRFRLTSRGTRFADLVGSWFLR